MRACWLLLALAGCAHGPHGEFSFGVMGDTPYTEGEVRRLDALIEDINREPFAFVVHLGDIGSSANACEDAWLVARKEQFARMRHKLVVVPGDNEWTDCRDPAARMAAWRRLFCDVPLEVERQGGEFCEHTRWTAAGFLFVALNVAGSNNNVKNAAEHRHRMAAVLGWLDDSAAAAKERGLNLVVLMQANPFVTAPRDGYGALRNRLQDLGARYPRRIVLIHGDTHLHRDDEPLPGVRRIEVWGSPFVDWTRLGI